MVMYIALYICTEARQDEIICLRSTLFFPSLSTSPSDESSDANRDDIALSIRVAS